MVIVQVDGGESQLTEIPAGNWNIFQPVAVKIPDLDPGDYTLTVSLPPDGLMLDGKSAQIRDVELRSEAVGLR